MYKINVEKFVENEEYDNEMKNFKQDRYQGLAYSRAEEPQKLKKVRVLEVELTDDEFAAVKKATLNVM